jgi:hypothetical protein
MLESKTFRVWFGTTLLICVVAFGKALCAQEKHNATELVVGIYRVDIGDRLEVSVWRHPELSKTVVVDRAGNIRLPLIDVVKVSGLSVNDVADLLTRKLEFTSPRPQVTVAVSWTNSIPKEPVPSPPLVPELRQECCIVRKTL